MGIFGSSIYEVLLTIGIGIGVLVLFPGILKNKKVLTWLKGLWTGLDTKIPLPLPEFESIVKALQDLIDELRDEKEDRKALMRSMTKMYGHPSAVTAPITTQEAFTILWTDSRRYNDLELDAYLRRVDEKLEEVSNE